jgi:uncharacterized membrane protein YkvA (DUF1232 family)
MSETPSVPENSPAATTFADDIYEAWRGKVQNWLKGRLPEGLSDALLLLPDLAALVVRLIRHPQVPPLFKGQLLIAITYLIAPLDLVPEAVLGAAGLADDVVLVSIVLVRLLEAAQGLDKDLVRSQWSGKGDVVSALLEIARHADKMVHPNVLKGLRMLVGIGKPNPKIVAGDDNP